MARRMGGFLGRCLLPLLLLAASLIDWSLISLVNLLLFFAIRFTTPRRGYYSWKIYAVAWCTVIYSSLAILAQTTFLILWLIEGKQWSVASSSWARLFGFSRHTPWGSASFIYFIVLQLSAGVVALVQVLGGRLNPDSCWMNISCRIDRIGYHFREASCFLVPMVQLVVSISYPSWTSIPFFIFSCIGLVDWSLTSNFLALFRWWRPLEIYSVFNILLLYIYQLPVTFPNYFTVIAEFIGLYKMTSSNSDWLQICSGVSLLVYYFMLSTVKHDIQEMDSMMSGEGNILTERLLPSKHTFFVRRNRSGKNHTNVLLRGTIFRSFSINFFTYGFPVLLLALSFWSFIFSSICAFGLLAYVGYILYAFPSLFDLHRLNGSLLVFILLWTASTYVFNVGFTFFNRKFQKDMVIWETIGLWHYSIPSLFLLAQYCLGVFVALCNLVNNSVFLYLSGRDGHSADEDRDEETEDTMVLIVATVAWIVRKISRAITLGLMFLLVIKPGFIHAAYMCFFMLFLLSHEIKTKQRQTLILFCEVHFSILYILQLDLISKALKNCGPAATEILSQLGLSTDATTRDFLQIGLLLCFCAIHSHGYKMLLSFSRVLKDTPYPPLGFTILRTGLNKSVLLSVYSSQNFGLGRSSSSSNEKRISRYLSKVGQKFLSLYRSYGTYVAFLTILMTLYLVTPNYISFGYLFFLLYWIIGRQLTRKTNRRLWLPLKIYAAVIFVCTYSLSITPGFATWVSKYVKLYPDLGFDPEASLLHNVWQSMAILIVMQLYSYERRMSRFKAFDMSDPAEISLCGFLRRLLIWHSDKILSVTVFYASVSSISLFGFFYLLGLIICSTMPKVSQVPSKVFLLYTGFITTTEYLFQMWCKPAQMCPSQRPDSLAIFIGFNYYDSGFWGVEAGLRGKILVTIACLLQYNVFHWLDLMPASLVHKGKWEEPCQLFLSREDSLGGSSSSGNSINSVQNNITSKVFTFFSRRQSHNLAASGSSSQTFGSTTYEESDSMVNDGSYKYSFSKFWGTSKESEKWNKSRIVALRKDRSETQITTLKAFVRFWFENLFKIRGLEFNMMMLLLTSFAVLNVVSMFYIVCLVIFILLSRDHIRKIWPFFVFLFASILMLEYFALWRDKFPWNTTSNDSAIHCHDCWKYSKIYFSYCVKCWLGITVDDPRMLLSYYLVFIFSSFKLRLDHLSGFSDSYTYQQMRAQMKNASVWNDLSFEIKSLWTFLDYVRLYAYCHLLDIVLSLILITGTLEYDVLHLGYLGFALVFFRMRLQILKKKNKIFKYLRIYNFVLIVLSLAYQSPFVGDFSSGGKCEELDYLYEIVGFYKYDYGFKITSRSALVEIIIFLLVSLQSYIFASSEFDHVARYLEAEQIGAMVREQEKKAARKTEQLQYVGESEERKRQRNMQVEKMKSEMLNLQLQLDRMSSIETMEQTSPRMQGLRKRRKGCSGGGIGTDNLVVQEESNAEQNDESGEKPSFEFTPLESYQEPPLKKADTLHPPLGLMSEYPSPMDYVRHSLDPVSEITEIGEDEESGPSSSYKEKENINEKSMKEHPLKSAVQLLGDGVSQVQSLGNLAVTNIVSFLNIDPDQLETNARPSHEDMYVNTEKQRNSGDTGIQHGRLTRVPSFHARMRKEPQAAAPQIRVILRHIWYQMRSNNDYVCYCCFIVVFLWNFSLLSMVYLAALFLYALCANSGPSYLFWVTMLIYTEMNILAQYVYQIIIQHCGLSIKIPILQRLGFPEDKIKVSFVVSVLPLFLVYLTTLLESSITASDGEWVPATEFSLLSNIRDYDEVQYTNYNLTDRLQHFFSPVVKALKIVGRSCIWYWRSLTQGAESPPYFVQLTMDVKHWPEDGIQPERVESWINKILAELHEERCMSKSVATCSLASRVRIQSINKSEEDEKMALAILEVVYASPTVGCQVAEWYKSLTPAADVAKEIQDAQSEGMLEEVGFPYPVVSVVGGGKREIDLYAYVFCADLAVFFLVAMFYQSVIKNTSEILEYYQLEDQFPKEFVFILMVIFFLIVVDRIIYLWSFATGRFIFYIFNLVLFTYSVTKYAWNMESSNKSISALVLRAIYLTKSVSLALQALQLHHGIPNKSTLYRQFLTSKVTQVNYLGFRLYRALPFLYELRCVLDWSCTTTSLTMYDWLKLEDIYASLYLVKCDALLNRANHKIGEKQSKMTKFGSGICLFLILIGVIWAPMLMYSSGNPTNIANPVIDVSLQVDVKAHGGRLMLFQTTACERIHWVKLDTDVDLDPYDYLSAYNVQDIQLICCQPDASTMWLIPPIVRKRYVQTLNLDDDELDLIITWNFIRARPKGKESVKYESTVDSINAYSLKRVLNGTTDSFRIMDGYPRYFRVTGSGEVRRLDYVADSVSGDLVLNNATTPWWSYHNLDLTDQAGCSGLDGPMAIVVSEETPQGILGETLSKFSIWSLYITFVLAVARFIRLQCSDLRMRIPYENLPSCDRLIDICEGIYAARAEGELEVEEVLYWTVVKIYRSPHMLMEYTKDNT